MKRGFGLIQSGNVRHMLTKSISTDGKVLPLGILTKDETSVRDVVSRFAKDRVSPLVREMEAKSKVDPSIARELFTNGLMGIEIPEMYGGSGNSLMSTILVIEELAKVEPALSIIAAIQNSLVNNFIVNFGSDEQKKKYLPLLAEEWVGCFCLSESASGSDAFSMKTTAKADGDDFILNGSKMWISNAALADIFVVFVNADPSRGYRGITTFVLERSMSGLSIGPPEDKLGLRCSETCPVHLDNVRVPKTAVLGELYKGYQYAAGCLNESRIGVAAQMLGICEGCFDTAVEYTLQRNQSGRPIYDFQGLQHEIAKISTQIDAARLLVYNSARMVEAGLPIAKEAATAKYYASELAQEVTKKSIDWMGGVGFTKGFLPEKFYRDCKVGTIYEGTSLIQLNTIAKLIKKERSA